MKIPLSDLLLTPQAMAAVDLAAVRSGLDSFALMQRAGQAVAAAALRLFPHATRYVVLCGPGNNGGDGYVAAETLRTSGTPVALFHLENPQLLTGDAARALQLCSVTGEGLELYQPQPGDLIIDAVFGAGLSRPVPPVLASVIETATAAKTPVIAADLPSGVCGLTGRVLGAAFKAVHTVTFMARKPGHLLMPGRELCGSLEIFDIGIPHRLVRAEAGRIAENTPACWQEQLPEPVIETHKFRRGHLVVFSGGAKATGAARMSAMAGFRIGAGLVTIASPSEALAVNAASLTAIMLHEIDNADGLSEWLQDRRLTTFVLGPGFGIGAKARQFVEAIRHRRLVLDADGITSFRDQPQTLFDAFAEGETRLVLTPHEGEFARLFPNIAADKNLGKVEKAQQAAALSHAVVIYKGADSVIAAPDGRALINSNAPPWLATAGSGDVLAGMIGGLLAQGVPAFEAAAAAVYHHGVAAMKAGEGMTAEDLVAAVRP
jgi:NAD(P)H-hydrate epimerase